MRNYFVLGARFDAITAMTVWTHVSLTEVNTWLGLRGMPSGRSLQPIAEGVEDSVFRLDLADGTVTCLRLFERTEPDGPLGIAATLASCGLPTCPPLADAFGRLAAPLRGKPAALYPWVEGGWVERPSLNQIHEIGVFLGRMAKEGPQHCQGWRRENPRGWPWFTATAGALLPVLPPKDKRILEEEMSVQSRFWRTADPRAIAHGPIHADMFRNNVLFGPQGKLAAVIDWGFCASDSPLIYDLAIVANDWCLKGQGPDLDPVRLGALLAGRESVAPLSSAEEKAWPLALRLAALRFYLSRQYDFSFPRNEDGKTLDPKHFHEILLAHRARKQDPHRPAARPGADVASGIGASFQPQIL